MKKHLLFILLLFTCWTYSQDTIAYRDKNEVIDILCVSSSWGVNTWYYLPFMLKDAGIQFRFHGLYIGAASFKKWNIVFSTYSDPELRYWTFNNYDGHRDNYYNHLDTTGLSIQELLSSQCFDVIITNNGAATSTKEDLWYNESDHFVGTLQSLLDIDGILVYNSTWCPAISGLYITTGANGYVAPNNIPKQYNVVDHFTQDYFQDENWRITQEWCSNYNLTHIIPNGALMYMLRHDPITNTHCFTTPVWDQQPLYKDLCAGDSIHFSYNGHTCNMLLSDDYGLCIDGLHAASGMPSFALALNAFATIFSPMYQVPFSQIKWRPTSIKQRVHNTGNENYKPSYATEGKIPNVTDFEISLSEEQVSMIIQAIHVAQKYPFERRTISEQIVPTNSRRVVMVHGQVYYYDLRTGMYYNMRGNPIDHIL